MNTLPENAYDENIINRSILAFCKEYSLGKSLKKANAYKSKGIPVIQIFMYLLQLVYTKKSMYMNILNGTHRASFSQNAVYRLLNSSFINWSAFLLSFSLTVITSKVSTLTSSKRMNAIIVDDTLYSRPRSKNVELMARVHDHTGTGAKFRKGFRMLTVAWSDGRTLVPLTFRHLSSENKKQRYNEMKADIDKRSNGYKARKQAIQKSPAVLIDMLKQIVRIGVPAKHVLFDTWFAFPATIIEIAKLKLSVVARIKNSSRIKYWYEDEKLTLSEIYKLNKKRRGRSKYLLSVLVKLYNSNEELVDARIVYVKDKKNRKKWIAIISTDLNLSEEEVIQLYGKRWDIEVFFKICKSYLNLGKEFQSLSYDAITAHTAVVMTRYIMLALEKRQTEDPRSLGEIFFACYDELADIQLVEALELIFSSLREVLRDELFLTNEQINDLIDAFIVKLPGYLKRNLVCQKAS